MVQSFDKSATGYEIIDAYPARLEQVPLHCWKFVMWVFVESPIITAGTQHPNHLKVKE